MGLFDLFVLKLEVGIYGFKNFGLFFNETRDPQCAEKKENEKK